MHLKDSISHRGAGAAEKFKPKETKLLQPGLFIDGPDDFAGV
jgi:hypothetical protein